MERKRIRIIQKLKIGDHHHSQFRREEIEYGLAVSAANERWMDTHFMTPEKVCMYLIHDGFLIGLAHSSWLLRAFTIMSGLRLGEEGGMQKTCTLGSPASFLPAM